MNGLTIVCLVLVAAGECFFFFFFFFCLLPKGDERFVYSGYRYLHVLNAYMRTITGMSFETKGFTVVMLKSLFVNNCIRMMSSDFFSNTIL